MAFKTPTAKEDGIPKGLSVQGFVDASFKGLDRNKDGAITSAEVFEPLGPVAEAPVVAFVENKTI